MLFYGRPLISQPRWVVTLIYIFELINYKMLLIIYGGNIPFAVIYLIGT
jgi:hypothetical protein